MPQPPTIPVCPIPLLGSFKDGVSTLERRLARKSRKPAAHNSHESTNLIEVTLPSLPHSSQQDLIDLTGDSNKTFNIYGEPVRKKRRPAPVSSKKRVDTMSNEFNGNEIINESSVNEQTNRVVS